MDSKEIAEDVGVTVNADIKQEPLDADQTDPDDVTTPLIAEGSEHHEMEEIKYVNTQDYLDIGETTICEQDRAISGQDRATPGTSSKHIKVEIIEVDQELEPPEDESEQLVMEVKQEDEDDELGGDEDPDSPEIKYSNTQDYLDIGETVVSEPSGTTASISTENKSETERKNKSVKEVIKCEICHRRFIFTKLIHMRTLNDEKSSKCESCDYRLRRKDDLKKREKPYKCEACDYRFTRNSDLKNHMRTHTGEKPYKCEACDYRSAKRYSLNIHMRKHTGEKPYKCDACDYRCTEGSNLKTHMRSHTGEKPYKCEACDYRFTVRSSLKSHMRTHTGEKPFKCETCDYRCTESGSLKKHMRYSCKAVQM